MALPSATDIRNNLEGFNITESIISDTWINNQLNYIVVPYVNSFIRSDISTEKTVIEYCSGTGNDILLLNRRNINSVVKIELVSGTDIDATINLSSIQLISEEGTLKVKSGLSQYYNYRTFPKGNKNIRITYKVGGTLPDDLRQAIMDLVCIKILDNIEGRTGGGSLTVQAFSRDYGNMGKYSNIRKRLNQSAQNVLRRYSTAVVGS